MGIYNLPLFIVKPISLINRFMPKLVLNVRYYSHNKCFINWKNPRNLHEYALSLLFNTTTDIEEYARLADKVSVRDFVSQLIGEQYLTRLYGVYGSSKDINLDELPDSFVVKTNNGCGNNIIVRDKRTFNEGSRIQLDYWLQFPYGDLTGQKHYSRIKPLIFVEELLRQTDDADVLPYDYKFFCINGEPKYVLYYEGRTENQHVTPNMLFDLNWTPLPQAVLRPTTHNIPKPKSFDEMLICVKRLCAGFKFVRVDFYEIDGRPVFGEMTFTPDILVNIHESFIDTRKFELVK